MAEPLKNSFGADIPVRIAEMIQAVHPQFDSSGFIRDSLDGYELLELTPRARRISDVLAQFLPESREEAIEVVIAALGFEIDKSELTGMGSFIYFPFVLFVADYGLDCFETSMLAQYELTKRFTAEFSIRAFIERYPKATLRRLTEWTSDPNVHVRRLVSEGTRPRLPWAPRLRSFQADPSPVIRLLRQLKADPEEYVRRSVANNLNDISKDHPDLVVRVAQEWWPKADANGRRLIRHGLRTLIKAGDAGALAVIGYGPDSPILVRTASAQPQRLSIGDRVRLEVRLENPSDVEAGALVDLRVYFVKANGSTSPKVFKGAELKIAPGGQAAVGKSISVAQHTTRKHYPGVHRFEVMLNGITHPGTKFEIM